MAEQTIVLQIEGMTCDGCAQSITHALKRAPGIKQVKVDWRAGTGEVTFDALEADEQDILGHRIFTAHYRASVLPLCCG